MKKRNPITLFRIVIWNLTLVNGTPHLMGIKIYECSTYRSYLKATLRYVTICNPRYNITVLDAQGNVVISR